MKRDAFTHPKTLDLASRLDISRAHAIGILALLCDFTATYAPQGDIGKHRDGAIARGCDWVGNPGEFIQALLDSGWLDLDPSHRLVVHDWEDHCEQWVRLKLAKLKLAFIVVKSSAEPIAEPIAERSAEASASRDLSYPILSPPSLAKPSPSSTLLSSAVPTRSMDEDEGILKVDFDDCLRSCLRLSKACLARSHKLSADEIWKLVWMAMALGQDGLIAEVATKIHNREVTKPKAYIDASLRKACIERNTDMLRVARCAPERPKPITANADI